MTVNDNTLRPFAAGTVSLALYAEPAAPLAMLEQVFKQAEVAENVGIHGVTISEHHAGFVPYLPNPVQVAGWILDRTDRLWAGPCPLLLPVRPTTLVIEELAWLAALHPGRLGAGVAPGYSPTDFEIFGLEPSTRGQRFASELPILASALAGQLDGPLAADPAIDAIRQEPVPLLATAGSATAARRAATSGAGILTDTTKSGPAAKELFDIYRDAGGTGPLVLNRRVWVGEPPTDLLRGQQARYEDAGASDWMPNVFSQLLTGDAQEIGQALADVRAETGADHLGLKVHIEGISVDALLDQITGLGDVLAAMEKASESTF